MLAAVYTGERILEIKELPLKELGPDDVLIKVDTAAICGTDMHIIDGEVYAKKQVVIGHEFSGYVEDMGNNVTNCKKGDLVTIEPHIFCNKCKFCRIGKVQQCLNKLAFGVHLNGGFAQYAIIPQHTVYTVPESISPEEAALVENIGCCLHGIDRANVEMGDTVVILGGGVVGILLTQIAKLRGASRVIVSEPIESRRRILLERGADIVVDPLSEPLQKVVMGHTQGLGADIVIEAAGRIDTAQQVVELAARFGTVMFYGLVSPGRKINIEPYEIFFKELTIVGSVMNPFSHYRALEILPILNVKELVTHRFKLLDINKAFEIARQGLGLKVCIKPNLE